MILTRRIITESWKFETSGTGIAESVVRFVSRLAAHLCSVGSSPAEDIMMRLCVNGWQFPPGCSGFTGYFPVPIQLETTQAFLHHLHQTVL